MVVYLILLGDCSASISLLLIIPFISLLNSSTNTCFLYPLPLSAFLHWSWFLLLLFQVQLLWLTYNCLYQIFFIKKSPVDVNSNFPIFKSSKIFQISINLFYIYVKIHYICSSIFMSLILIQIYAIINSATLLASLSNKNGFAIFIWY